MLEGGAAWEFRKQITIHVLFFFRFIFGSFFFFFTVTISNQDVIDQPLIIFAVPHVIHKDGRTEHCEDYPVCGGRLRHDGVRAVCSAVCARRADNTPPSHCLQEDEEGR